MQNLTQDDIDVEFLSRALTRELRKSKNFAITNAIAGSGAQTDKLITESRRLTKDKQFNQYTTQENGKLLAPNYSLGGKITERRKNMGEYVRIDYDFLFILTDLRTGLAVWDSEEHIAKMIEKTQLANFGKLGAGSCEGGDVLACEKEAQAAMDALEYDKAKELLHKACKLGAKEACEDLGYLKQTLKQRDKAEKERAKEAKRDRARLAKQERKEIRRSKRLVKESRFGISIGADIGIGAGSANMVPIPYTHKYEGEGLIFYDNKTPWKDMITWPYMLKAGGYYQQDVGLYLSANVLYGGYNYNAADSWLAFNCSTGSCWSDMDINSLDFSHKLFGGGGRIGFSADPLVVFAGGGALKDVGSTMKGTGAFIINEKLDNIFPFWEIGLMATFEYFFVEASYRHLFNGKDDKNWASIGSFNLGLGFMLPIW